MKKYLFIFVFFVLANVNFAQTSDADSEQAKAFFETKTYIVLDGNISSPYDPKLKEFAQKYWKVTQYEFIASKDFEKKRKEPKTSFLVRTSRTYQKDKADVDYSFMSLLLGGKEFVTVADMPILCNFPLTYDHSGEDFVYKMLPILLFMQKHVKETSEHPGAKSNLGKYYGRNVTGLKEKTLYVLATDLTPEMSTKEAISEVYPYKIEIISRAEMDKIIDSRDSSAVILFKTGPTKENKKQATGKCFKTALGADGTLYYAEKHQIDPKTKQSGFLKKDLKKLAKLALK